jgi:hypothetical protein
VVVIGDADIDGDGDGDVNLDGTGKHSGRTGR